MEELKKIIAYYRQCYQADNRSTSIYNFFSKKIKHQLLFNTANLLTGITSQYPVPLEWGQEAERTLAIYSKEKQLYAGSFFLIGKGNVAGKTVKICAPMLLSPLSLVKEDDVYYLSLSSSGNMINPSFINLLKPYYHAEQPINDYLEEHLPEEILNFDSCFKMENALKSAFPELEMNSISEFPELLTENDLKKRFKNPDQFCLVSAIGVGIIPNSQFSRGLLNELAEMSKADKFSKPLQELFHPVNKTIARGKKNDRYFVHANLSEAQRKILIASDNNILTQVVGPPGTGKSFTIAAIAVEAIGQGKSVLICSKNNQAVDVIGDKIKRDFQFENLVVRGGKSGYKRAIKDRIKNIINGISVRPVSKRVVNQFRAETTQRQTKLLRFEHTTNNREKEELSRSALLLNPNPGFIQRIKKKILSYRIQREIPYWELVSVIEKDTLTLHDSIYNYLTSFYNYRLHDLLRRDRQQFKNLERAIKGRTGNRKESFFQQINFDTLLMALPIWLVNSNDINNVLPLEKELFDLVIIDEASQCDIASSLPLLQRAKKAIVVGDPKQLRHISFLSRTRQLKLIQTLGLGHLDYHFLDYRNQSILDLVSDSLISQNQLHFLDEHYRSLPEIIRFSNQYFYGNSLKIMTQLSGSGAENPIQIVRCNGQRNARGINTTEIEAIFLMIKSILEKESNMEPQHCQSIGILSPFREQINAIQKRLESELTLEELNRHQLLAGTPHSFQGEERDIMLLSFVIDNQCHPSTFQYLNKEDVFNVSITRARNIQILYISCANAQLSSKNLLRQYLESTQGNIPLLNKSFRIQEIEKFQQEIIQLLEDMNVDQVSPGYELAGMEIDILFINNNKTFAIDLIGYPGRYQNSFSLNGYKTLFRIGIHVLAIPYSLWLTEQATCIEVIEKASKT